MELFFEALIELGAELLADLVQALLCVSGHKHCEKLHGRRDEEK